jgi:hypothetical protein
MTKLDTVPASPPGWPDAQDRALPPRTRSAGLENEVMICPTCQGQVLKPTALSGWNISAERSMHRHTVKCAHATAAERETFRRTRRWPARKRG